MEPGLWNVERTVETTLRRFAGEVEAVLLAGEAPDGDPGRLSGLLARARAIGIVADPAPAAPGYDLGVWGRQSHADGLGLSLLTLSLLGETCAGFAAAVHAQGLACLALAGQAAWPEATPLAAVFTPSYGIALSDRLQAEGCGLHLTAAGDAFQLNGASHFFLAAEPPARLIAFALRSAGEWIALVVEVGAAGVELIEVTHRTGLRLARQYHLRCDQVAVAPGQVLATGEEARRRLQTVIACDWLGQAAIALGIARRALRESRAYTAQRYQGGQMIEKHASVQLLQATAGYDIATLDAILRRHAGAPLASLDPPALLRWAITARLAVGEHAHRAVTHCLQTFGGYGYMEDYPLAGRLRDVATLKSLHGSPDQLKLFLNEIGEG